MDTILAELVAREPIFHRPEHGTTRADFERMIHPDFHEIGASGRLYSRSFILDELGRRYTTPQKEKLYSSCFHCARLAIDLYLLTYDLFQPPVRRTRRTTLWQQTAAGWQIRFHQGTVVQDTLQP